MPEQEEGASFGAVIGPVMGQLGLEAEPQIYRVQGSVTRGGVLTV